MIQVHPNAERIVRDFQAWAETAERCEHDWGGPPSLGAECLVCGAQCEDLINADGSPVASSQVELAL